MKNLTILLIALSSLAGAEGNYLSEMEGLYYIWGDPVDRNDDPGVEGFSIFIEGEAAERLFKKMESKANLNECWDDGTLTKYQGSLECSVTPENMYSCSFGVNLNDQKIYRAESC